MDTPAISSDALLRQATDRFWETIPPVWHRIRSNLQEIITEYSDITVEQFHILRHIHQGSHSTSQLADEKQISRPAISQIVDTLVGKGLITRQQSLEDRRFVQLGLSAAGTGLLHAIFEKNRVWMMGVLSALSAEELDRLLDAMQTLHQVFSDLPENPTHKHE